MKKRNKRLAIVMSGLAGFAMATALVLSAFQDALVFFITPSEVMAKTEMPERNFRIGGLVEAGSVTRHPESTRVTFNVTDTAESVTVVFDGILPDLFREGQGVVAEGRIDSEHVFHAYNVMARHDEDYMPVEAQEAMDRVGRPGQTAGGTD